MAENAVDVIHRALKENSLNLGLYFDKYVFWHYNKREKRYECDPRYQVSLIREIRDTPKSVKALLSSLEFSDKTFEEKIGKNKLSISSRFLPLQCYSWCKDRIDYLLNALNQMGFKVKYIPDKKGGLALNWRLIINLGAASVYETSLLFHRNYSVPYIPGSAVKGVTRHWSILKFSDFSTKDAKEIDNALMSGKDLGLKVGNVSFTDLIDIFGSQNERGKVAFFDAYPITDSAEASNLKVAVDIMNIHYRPYYEGSDMPGDWHKPVPVFFLVVEKGSRFRFALASKKEDLVEKAADLLKEALREMGVGAKTSAGYGYFNV